jgi:hypothetical protein
MTTPPGAKDKAPPARAAVEREKPPSDDNVIVHSKRFFGFIDVDKAGDVSQDDDADDADGQGSDSKGSDSDMMTAAESTKDTDDNAEEDGGLDSDKNACEPESGSSDADDLIRRRRGPSNRCRGGNPQRHGRPD